MPTIFRSRRFSRQKDIFHSKCDASKSTRECIFLPVVPTSTLGIRFERALVLLFGEDDFGARSIQSSSSPESSSSCCARLVVVRRISLFVFVFFFFFFFGKKLDYSFSFRPFCFGETKRRRDLFDFLSLSLSKIVLLSGFLQRWSSSSLAVVVVVYVVVVVREQKKRRLVGLVGSLRGWSSVLCAGRVNNARF